MPAVCMQAKKRVVTAGAEPAGYVGDYREVGSGECGRGFSIDAAVELFVSSSLKLLR